MCGVPLGGWSLISWSSLYSRLCFTVPLRLREGRVERFDKQHFKNGKQCGSLVAAVLDADTTSLALQDGGVTFTSNSGTAGWEPCLPPELWEAPCNT